VEEQQLEADLVAMQQENPSAAEDEQARLRVEQERGLDVLMFELDEQHDEQLMGRYKAPWDLMNPRHNTVVGLSYKPSPYEKVRAMDLPEVEDIRTHVRTRSILPLATLADHIAWPGSSGTGLMDSEHKLVGVIASVQVEDGIPVSNIVTAEAFRTLWTKVLIKEHDAATDDAVIINNANLLADKAVAFK